MKGRVLGALLVLLLMILILFGIYYLNYKYDGKVVKGSGISVVEIPEENITGVYVPEKIELGCSGDECENIQYDGDDNDDNDDSDDDDDEDGGDDDCDDDKCKKNSDCGEDIIGNNYCLYGDAYRLITTFSCENGKCKENGFLDLVQDCAYGCTNGACNIVECSNDSDCGDDYYENDYCSGNNIFTKLHKFECLDGGCDESISELFIKNCDYGCSNGECIGECDSDDDCGDDQVCENHECVDIECDDNDDCDDSNAYTSDVCINPGETNSYCNHEEITCLTNSDCGDSGFIGKGFCSEDDVFKQFKNYECLNAGSIFSSCELTFELRLTVNCGNDMCDPYSDEYCKSGDVYKSKTCYDRGCDLNNNVAECFEDQSLQEELVEDCLYGCNNGECIVPECTCDSDCADDFYSNNYCSNGDVKKDFHDFSCMGGECNENIESLLVMECANGCNNGECIVNPPECTCDSDCGEDYNSANYCYSDDSYYDAHHFQCYLGQCNEQTQRTLAQDCLYGCLNGECVEPECSKDVDCGTDYYSNNYCSSGDVYKDLHDFACNNRFCNERLIPQIVEECANGCLNGVCVDTGECSLDSDCDDNNSHTLDKCNNPGTAGSYCTNTPINCLTNSDCGINGFVGKEFCTGDDVFKNKQTAICKNPGTADSYCDVKVIPTFLTDCGDDYNENNSYCYNGDVYSDFHDFSCSIGVCYEALNPVLKENCEYGCSNGVCVGECNNDDDCSGNEVCDNSECVIPQCSDGIDNDSDGKIDALVEDYSNLRKVEYPFHDAWEIRAFVNGLGVYTQIPSAWNNAGAVRYDSASINKVCELSGYPNVERYGWGEFDSCDDNKIAYWSASANNFIIMPACNDNQRIAWLVCSKQVPVTACTDGLDNDSDGKADMEDDGCASEGDVSEVMHDNECSSLSDNSEEVSPTSLKVGTGISAESEGSWAGSFSDYVPSSVNGPVLGSILSLIVNSFVLIFNGVLIVIL